MANILHNKVFEFCESYRALHPDFLYWLRERNTKNRLEEGNWFQGRDDYAFVGLYDRGGGSNMTRSVGLVFSLEGDKIICHLENVFNEEDDKNILSFYSQLRTLVGGFKELHKTKYQKVLSTTDGFSAASSFLDDVKPIIDNLVKKNNLNKLFITQEKFDEKLQRVLQYRSQIKSMNDIKYILVNISWNSNDWKGVSEDKSGHKWVSKGNIPHESWNFDFDNVRNTQELIRGYCQFTNPPKVNGDNNLIIFYSQNQIVGFYGKAEVLHETVKINQNESYNLLGNRHLSFMLKHKITDVKEKGYLENKERVGQIGFSYLEKNLTISEILNEALYLNPELNDQITQLANWLGLRDFPEKDEFDLVCESYNANNITQFLNFLNKVVKMLSIPVEDKRVVFSAKQKGLNFIVGQRYSINLSKKDNLATFGFISTKKLQLYDGEFSGTPTAYYNLSYNINDLYDNLDEILNAINIELERTNFSGFVSAENNKFRNSVFGNTQIKNNILNMDNNETLNTILFGPPGTGKTYHTITEAIQIVDSEYFNQHITNRNKLQERFNELLIKDWEKTEGQISFCTFHQSFSYEDFVEGIKPLKPEKEDKSVKYDIVNGIFKKICRLADASNNAQQLAKENLVSLTQEEFEKAVFYKISLGDTTKDEDKEIYDYCINNNQISIGFATQIDFTGQDESAVNQTVSDAKIDAYSAQAINYFKNYLKNGNYVVVSYGNSYIRALGKVTGDYEYKLDSEIEYNHFRKVEWIFKNVEIPVAEFYQKNLSQQTIYKLKSEYIRPEFFVRRSKPVDNSIQQKKYVLVIDEINRGNVSSIFGELITLIEPTKRSGKPEALEVVLPYSKERFTVPSNVFIIGTMNTADRSIESLDTALRRRFSFKEMIPEPDLILTVGKSKGKVDGIDMVQMLQKINERIEKLIDKDHKIGHSYFLDVLTAKELELAFKDKVIPLLEEYFFGDFGKIGLVLGNSFIRKEEMDDFNFAVFEDYDPQTEQDLRQRSVYKIQPVQTWDYKSIYEPK